MDAFIDQLVEAHNEVIADMREKLKLFTAGPSMIDAFKAFASAIDWTVCVWPPSPNLLFDSINRPITSL